MAADVWVLVERQGDELHEVTLELLGDARKLAMKRGVSLCAVLMGDGVAALSETLAHFGAQKVFLLEHALLAQYTTDAYVFALAGLIKEHNPEVVMIGGTPNGNDLAPRLAARLNVGL